MTDHGLRYFDDYALSKPDRGIMKTAIEAVNQDGRTVMRATAINFLRVRPDADA